MQTMRNISKSSIPKWRFYWVDCVFVCIWHDISRGYFFRMTRLSVSLCYKILFRFRSFKNQSLKQKKIFVINFVRYDCWKTGNNHEIIKGRANNRNSLCDKNHFSQNYFCISRRLTKNFPWNFLMKNFFFNPFRKKNWFDLELKWIKKMKEFKHEQFC